MISEQVQKELDVKAQSVRNGYIICLALCYLIVLIAWLFAEFINNYYPLNSFFIRLIQIHGYIFPATAFFGLKGWEIQTWDGNTSPEVLNYRFFRILSGVGFFLAFLGFLLEPIKI